ncbi:MAG: DNA recombination protein RmuC [Thiomicrorhabdus sp.]|nr:DNA recombination protein RmuC [Thiomicrorhabdus sp.]MCF6298549.1 DNA recombination protein RmuC [Thiomicrorhabdus sp.]
MNDVSAPILSLILLLAGMGVFLAIKLFRSQKQQQQIALQLQQQSEQLIRQEALVEQLAEQKMQNSLLNQQLAELQSIKSVLPHKETQLDELKAQLQQKEHDLNQLRNELNYHESRVAELTVLLENEKSHSQEKLALLESTKKQLANEFEVLSNRIFESKQAQFTQQTQSTMDAILKPVQGSLEAFKQRIELVHKEDVKERASLTEQLRQLHTLNHQMSEETQNLTQALKGDSKLQGNWGELILERLLERSGLTEGVEFDREKSFTDESGKRLRPDVILNLPDNKHVVIDSKVSLLHYEQSLNSNDETARASALKQHLQSLKNHIDTLADKRYESLDQLNAPDFVLMFIPIEGAYLMAIEADASIFETAFEKRVAVVTPTTLFTSLKTIEQLWRYERQSENTLKLIKRAAEVHDKFVGFVESFEKVGKQLQTAQNTYETTRSQMLSGKGNLVRQAEMLKELAGKTKKEIPEHLLEEAESGMDEVSPALLKEESSV